MIRTAFITACLLALAACGSSDTATDKAAQQAAAKRQKTVFDDQLKAIDKAKAVEGQLQDEKAKRDAELDAQEKGG